MAAVATAMSRDPVTGDKTEPSLKINVDISTLIEMAKKDLPSYMKALVPAGYGGPVYGRKDKQKANSQNMRVLPPAGCPPRAATPPPAHAV